MITTFKHIQPENIKELALVSSSALDMAIFELTSGNSEAAFKTLQELHDLLFDVAGLNPVGKIEVN